jgi:hypothetical protein
VWSIAGSGGNNGSNQRSGYQAARGVFSGTSVYNRLRQTVDVPTNTNYIAGVWVRGSGRITLRVYGGSGPQISATKVIDATPTWTWQTTAAFSTGANTKAIIQVDDNSSTPATIYVDDAFLGVSGGANQLVNADFERGDVAWDSAQAGPVWKISQY